MNDFLDRIRLNPSESTLELAAKAIYGWAKQQDVMRMIVRSRNDDPRVIYVDVNAMTKVLK